MLGTEEAYPSSVMAETKERDEGTRFALHGGIETQR